MFKNGDSLALLTIIFIYSIRENVNKKFIEKIINEKINKNIALRNKLLIDMLSINHVKYHFNLRGLNWKGNI